VDIGRGVTDEQTSGTKLSCGSSSDSRMTIKMAAMPLK
jgi:hypothetical protein